jgi:hypothetical protein
VRGVISLAGAVTKTLLGPFARDIGVSDEDDIDVTYGSTDRAVEIFETELLDRVVEVIDASGATRTTSITEGSQSSIKEV